MKCNVSQTGRVLRLLVGTFLTAWAVAGGPGWAWVGVLIIATGAWRFCPLFYMLGIRH